MRIKTAEPAVGRRNSHQFQQTDAAACERRESCQTQKKTTMKTIDFNTPADLYLGSDHATAQAQGHRHFATTVAAIRFAMEQAAPVSLRGAMLCSGERWLTGDDIRAVYCGDRRFQRMSVPEVAALNAA